MSTLKSIAMKTAPRAPMQELERAEITIEKGITGDLRGSQAGRQITILCELSWQTTCDAINTELP
ncbi:MOSC domain-containing protein, partial [candidate division KSB1 bacterium]|nr:MOSC domain-containing protein [candidate division KSB1 bacterium]